MVFYVLTQEMKGNKLTLPLSQCISSKPLCMAWSWQNPTNVLLRWWWVQVESQRVLSSLIQTKLPHRQWGFCDGYCPFNAFTTGACYVLFLEALSIIKINFAFPLLNILFYFLLWNQKHSCAFLSNMLSLRTWTKLSSVHFREQTQ